MKKGSKQPLRQLTSKELEQVTGGGTYKPGDPLGNLADPPPVPWIVALEPITEPVG
jgi:bacteriocin-like protein